MQANKFEAKPAQVRTAAHVEPVATMPPKSVLDDIADETHAKYGAELFAPRTRAELRDEADTMYRAGLLAKYLPKDAKQWTKEQRYAYATNRALIAFLAGAELGMLPLQAVRGIYFVEDQPSPAAKTLVGLIKKRTTICEYWMVEKATNTECSIVTKRRGTPKEERLTVTIDDFPKTWREEKTSYGSPKRPPWILWPSRQLHARCASWLAGQTYQDITLGFYAAEEMSSAAWERKYADTSRAVIQVPGNVESDDVLDQMVDAANEGESTEAPFVPTAETAQEAPAVPTKPARTKADFDALMARVKGASDAITPDDIVVLRAEIDLWADDPKNHAHFIRAWQQNGALNPAQVAP
jgi:SpoVK/Ycf46/Vps4 family AAA+-type ATPase